MPRIIEYMKRTGEWGEFLPIQYSSFAYNDSVAFEYYPLTAEEALAKGLRWRDPDAKEYVKSSYAVPDDIKDAPDSIINETLSCAECGKNYKIIAQELKFYKDMKLPVPVKCWLCRHKNRRLQKIHGRFRGAIVQNAEAEFLRLIPRTDRNRCIAKSATWSLWGKPVAVVLNSESSQAPKPNLRNLFRLFFALGKVRQKF